MKKLAIVALLIGAGFAQTASKKVPAETALAIRNAQVRVQNFDILLNACNSRRAKALEDAREDARKTLQGALDKAYTDAGLDQKTYVINDEKWEFEPAPKPEPPAAKK